MSKFCKMFLVPVTAAVLAAPLLAHASELRSVACSVSVDYLLNGVARAPYQKDFVVDPGTVFEDDFSTFTRFRVFNASTRLEAGDTVVAISYYNDVGVFDAVDFSTRLTLRDGHAQETVTGSHTFYTSRPTSAMHATNYTLTCSRAKN